MKKLILLTILVFLLYVASAFAIGVAPSDDDVDIYYKMEDSSTTIVDATSNNNDGSLTGTGWINQNSGIINFGLRSDDIGDYIDLGTPLLNSTSDWTYNIWFKYNGNCAGTAENIVFMSQYESGSDGRFLCRAISGTSGSFSCGAVGGWSMNPSWTCDNDWHMVTLRHEDDANVELFLDGEVISNVTETGTIYTGINTRIGEASPWGIESNIDESSFYGGVLLTLENIDFLYNAGSPTSDQQYPFFTPVTEINDSTESTAVVKQIGSVSFSVTPTTILSNTFNVTKNNTPLYSGYSFNVESTGTNNMFCELLINGTSYANVTRSQTTGVLGSVFVQTPVFLVDEGEYTQSLQCRRSAGAGLLTITNADGIGHFLIDQNNEIIKYNSSFLSNEVVSTGSSYTLIDSFNITIGNKTEIDLSQNRTNHIVLENQITYKNNAVGTQLLSAYMSINGSNCSSYPRTVASGSTGSVSMDCILSNVTANATYSVNVYANGTNALYNGNTIAKNFFLSEDEIVGGTGIITGYNFSGTTWNQIFNTSGGNLNHDVANAFTKLSYSVLTDTNTQVDFYVVISDGDTFTTNTWSRDFIAGQTGVLIGHDILENLPQDPNYNISLFARCGTVGANCTITGGSSLGYLTDVITTVINAFNVSAFDDWDDSSISNFTVVDGGTWSSVNGSALVFTEENPENLTISSAGYFNTTILNHNSSIDLNVTLKQSDIRFEAFEIISNSSIGSASFTIDGVSKGVNESFYLKAGSYNVTIENVGYYSSVYSFNVSPLDNLTIDVYLGNAKVNFTAVNLLDSVSVENFTIYIDGLNSSYSSFVDAVGSVATADLIQESFTFTFVKDKYLNQSVNFSLSSNYTEIEFVVYRTTVVNFNFYDEDTLLPVTDVDFNLFGSVFSNNFSTGAGNDFLISELPEDVYEVRYTASDYTIRSYWFIIPHVENDKVNASLYLIAENDSSLFVRNIQTQQADPLVSYFLEVQRPYVSEDNSSFIYRSVEIASIDSSGDAVFTAIPNTQQYRFRILDPSLSVVDVLNQGFLVDSSAELLALAEGSTMTDFNSVNDVVSSLYFINSTGYFILDYTAPLGVSETCLTVTGTLGSIVESSVSCSSEASGSIAVYVNTSIPRLYVAVATSTIEDTFIINEEEFDARSADPTTAFRYFGAVVYLLCVILSITLGNYINASVSIFGIIFSTIGLGLGFLGLVTFSSILLGGLLVVGIVVMLFVRN